MVPFEEVFGEVCVLQGVETLAKSVASRASSAAAE